MNLGNLKKRKASIQNQIFVWIGLIIIVMTIINLIFNNFILEKVYLESEKKEIIKIYNAISSHELSDEELQEIYSICSIKNITLFLTDDKFNPIFYNYNNYGDEAKEDIVEHMQEYHFDNNRNNFNGEPNEEIISNNDNYSIVKIKNPNNMEFLELRCNLVDGRMLLIRISIESIEENTQLFNTFSSITLLVGLALGLILSWIICKKISKPINELTNISEDMINLNFEKEYKLEANNEIDILGRNFNTLCLKLNSTLNELRDANKQLEADIKEKEKIDEMRKDFISNVSHELKTPIALIQGYSEALKEGIGDDKETNDYYCDIIIDESQRMNKLVKQLIDLNHLESNVNPISLESFDICELINGIISSYQYLIKEKNAKIITNFEENSILVLSDEFKIEQVFINYLTNALNHLDFDKNIIISIESFNSRIRVSVFNNGNNIPNEELDNIWLKFYKIDKARTRAYGGSGIGLSIVKATMEYLGQNFGVENKEDGVCFWFEVDKL